MELCNKEKCHLIDILTEGIKERDNYIKKMLIDFDNRTKRVESLLSKSEERIDKTNQMVDKLVVLMEHLTSEYSKHIYTISHSRDEVIEQNTILIKDIESFSKEIKAAQIRYDDLLKQLFIVLRSSNFNENNINIDSHETTK